MLFDISNFIMKALRGMIGKYPDFQVREYALNWHSKGKLTEDNLSEIDTLIEAQYIESELTEEATTEDEFVDENTTEETYDYTEDYTEDYNTEDTETESY